MKKFFIILLLFSLFSVAPAQFFELSLHDTIGQVSPSGPLYLDGYIKNISGNPLHIKMVRLENNLPDIVWSTGLCLGQRCLHPDDDSISTVDPIPPSDSIYFDIAIFITNFVPGTATILLKFATMDDAQVQYQWFEASSVVTNIGEDKNKPVSKFKLLNNYPNPFNNQTIISAQIDKPSKVTLHIFNILGREVFNMFKEIPSAGQFNFRWNGINNNGEELSSGIYFYRVSAFSAGDINQSEIKKLTLLR